jgi:hypothetical protein
VSEVECKEEEFVACADEEEDSLSVMRSELMSICLVTMIRTGLL